MAVYHNSRRMAPCHNCIVREEIEKMRQAGIIRSSDRSWFLPTVIATKENEEARFCFYHLIFNEWIKTSHYSITHIEKICDDLQGSSFFTSLDLFQGYSHVKMSWSCKCHNTFVTRLGTFSF